MKFKKLLIVPFVSLLLACNKQVDPFKPVTKQINDNEALSRSQEILSHQEDEGFVIPKRFRLTVMERKLTDEKTAYETRYSDIINNDFISFDLDNLIAVKKEKETTNGNIISIVNIYHFWKDGKYYYLYEENKNDINFKKYRTEQIMSREDAQAKIENTLDAEKEKITRIHDLRGFESTIINDQELHQKAQDNPEAKYDYRYGSNDINSLERTIDGYRITHDAESPIGVFDLHEETTKRRLFLDNNLLKLEYRSSTDDYKNNSNNYYASTHTEKTVNTNYSKNLKITLPNINDYPIKEE